MESTSNQKLVANSNIADRLPWTAWRRVQFWHVFKLFMYIIYCMRIRLHLKTSFKLPKEHKYLISNRQETCSILIRSFTCQTTFSNHLIVTCFIRSKTVDSAGTTEVVAASARRDTERWHLQFCNYLSRDNSSKGSFLDTERGESFSARYRSDGV